LFAARGRVTILPGIAGVAPRTVVPDADAFLLPRVTGLLTEQEVAKSWRKLFNGTDVDSQSFEKAETLLDELRAESPLRHRLSNELEQLRKMHTV
jgi:hypothetical protein